MKLDDKDCLIAVDGLPLFYIHNADGQGEFVNNITQATRIPADRRMEVLEKAKGEFPKVADYLIFSYIVETTN